MAITAPVHDKPCPACSFKNRREARFCGDCGRPMAGHGRGIGTTIALMVGLSVAGGGLLGFWKMSVRSGDQPWQHHVDIAREPEPPAAPAPEPAPIPPAPAPAPAPEERSAEAEQVRLAKVAEHAAAARRLLAQDKYMAAVAELKQANSLGGSPEVDGLWAELANPAPPVAAQPRPLPGKAGIKWVQIPGGSFMMGSGNGDEGPRHRVTVRAFQMAKTEVTVEQYKACVEAGACAAPDAGGYCNWGVSGRENHPVNCVDWNQAKVFSAWVGGRLHSEAEWEYASRSTGKEREYPWGDEGANCGNAVMVDDGGTTGCGRLSTWPVCSKPTGNTEQGLCDMAGNVWEWTKDRYHGSYDGAPADGSAWEGSGSDGRVVRGGSAVSVAGDMRSARRDIFTPAGQGASIGFRPARSTR